MSRLRCDITTSFTQKLQKPSLTNSQKKTQKLDTKQSRSQQSQIYTCRNEDSLELINPLSDDEDKDQEIDNNTPEKKLKVNNEQDDVDTSKKINPDEADQEIIEKQDQQIQEDQNRILAELKAQADQQIKDYSLICFLTLLIMIIARL